MKIKQNRGQYLKEHCKNWPGMAHFQKVLNENLYTAGKDIPIEVRIGFGDLGTSFYLSLSVHDIFCIE